MRFIERVALSAVELVVFVALSLIVLLFSLVMAPRAIDSANQLLCIAALFFLILIGAKSWRGGWGESLTNTEVAAFIMLIVGISVLAIQLIFIVKAAAVEYTFSFLFFLLFALISSAFTAVVLGLVFGTVGFLLGPFLFKEERHRHIHHTKIEKHRVDLDEESLHGAGRSAREHKLMSSHHQEIVHAKILENSLKAKAAEAAKPRKKSR